jgi:hypothetical protein
MRPAIEKFLATVTPHQDRFHRGLLHFFQELPISSLLRGTFLERPKVELDIADAAYQEASAGLHSVGVAAEDPWATEWHYLCYKNVIDFGRGAMTSFAPLMQQELVGLSRSPLNAYPAPKEGTPSIVTDLLIALHPELALMPFDDHKKNMTSSYVEERSKFLGRVARVEPYSVVGDPYAVNYGTPRLFLKLVAARCFEGRFTPQAIQELVARGYECIPLEIQKAYRIPKYLVENELTPISTSSWPGYAAGKIMAFLLTD